MAGYRELSHRLAAWTGTMGDFSRQLDTDGTPYISFSKVVSVGFVRIDTCWSTWNEERGTHRPITLSTETLFTRRRPACIVACCGASPWTRPSCSPSWRGR